ncbi:hypothetical protein [Nonomuraea rhizosphaerae]|uniref:hypothetical protein n=1 Tax=Nonomuraea rhizosphaerae TaxID=2665663 RepID=UPI001C5D8DB4|nr:hypothetical protein [Nonomuraea rhizosphaerae]
MSTNLMDSLAPVLSVPVTRALAACAADGTAEVGQSYIGQVNGLIFAGDDQE